MPRSANDGIVRPTAEAEFATEASRSFRYTRTATSIAMTVASATHWTTRLACWYDRKTIWSLRSTTYSHTGVFPFRWTERPATLGEGPVGNHLNGQSRV